MDLQITWFILIGVLFSVFFVLEGFDYGVGIIMTILGKKEEDKDAIAKSIGPIWDGNEVWMLTAGGALFAAFPEWYATMFSSYFLALVLMLVALICRAIGLELRGKTDDPVAKNRFNIMFSAGSFVAALLWGVVAVNMLLGLPINENKEFVGNFFSLLDPRALVGGVTAVLLVTLHGSLFLAIRTKGELKEKALKLAGNLWAPVFALILITVALVIFTTNWIGIPQLLVGLIALTALAISFVFIKKGLAGKAFFATATAVLVGSLNIFFAIFPNVMISTLNPEFSLTIRNASSSTYTLGIMAVTAFIMVPIVIGYQAWVYSLFLKED